MREYYLYVYYRSNGEDESRESSDGRRWIERHPVLVHRRFDGDWLLCTVVDCLKVAERRDVERRERFVSRSRDLE